MTIGNPERFIQEVIRAGDFGSEPNRGFDETLLTRHDGARIWFRTYPSGKQHQTEIIGLVDGNGLTIMNLMFTHDLNDPHGKDPQITVGVVGKSENMHRIYRYRDQQWVREGITYDDNAPSPLGRALRGSGMFLWKNQLPNQINQEETVKIFLQHVLGWVQRPETFETASLKPVLVQ